MNDVGANRDTTEQLILIRDFVEKQRTLLDIVASFFDSTTNQYNFKAAIPATISSDRNHHWSLGVHGVGIRITSLQTGESIDAHVGILDAHDIFDAWRLAEYCDSISIPKQDHAWWKTTLQRLAEQGSITPHAELADHFELVN